MHRHSLYAVVGVLISIQLGGIDAYPLLNIPYIFGARANGANRYKKNDQGFPQVDDDVIELEHLKGSHNNNDHEPAVIPPSTAEPHQPTVSHTDLLPELERELELTASIATPTTTSTTAGPMITATPGSAATAGDAKKPKQDSQAGEHRPPTLPHHDGGKMTESGGQHQQAQGAVGDGEGSAMAPSMAAKPFYGAARLAFGQNPEVLPTTSTSSTSTTPTSITSIALSAESDNDNNSNNNDNSNSNNIKGEKESSNDDVHTSMSPLENGAAIGGFAVAGEEDETADRANHHHRDSDEYHKEIVGDVVVSGLEDIKTAMRRSVGSMMPPQTAASLLNHSKGQFSSFDLAQYVFWTGDESGVAHAVEELIEKGQMSRESALKFLHDIRQGLEYLQKSYKSRVFPEEIRQNYVKKTHQLASTTSTTTTTSTSAPMLDNLYISGGFDHSERRRLMPSSLPSLSSVASSDQQQQQNINVAKTVDNISLWNKLQELNSNAYNPTDGNDYDETNGRAKIAEFIYSQYTLENILYKLAKVMFLQSLTQGSNEAQRELQKLTDFLEREGNLGVIPLDLQKKVLHVLLTALNDTLSEHPELLPAARSNLLNPYNRLPIHAYGAIN